MNKNHTDAWAAMENAYILIRKLRVGEMLALYFMARHYSFTPPKHGKHHDISKMTDEELIKDFYRFFNEEYTRDGVPSPDEGSSRNECPRSDTRKNSKKVSHKGRPPTVPKKPNPLGKNGGVIRKNRKPRNGR